MSEFCDDTAKSLQSKLTEALRLLDLQRHRALYPMDSQIATQKEVAAFIQANK